MAVGIERGEPMASGFIAEDRMHLPAQFIEQPVAQQAVLPPAGKDGVAVAVGLPGGAGALGSTVRKYQFGVEIMLLRLRFQLCYFPGQEGIGLQEFHHIYFPGGILRHAVQEAPVGIVIFTVKDDLPAKQPVVERHLGGNHVCQVLRTCFPRLKHRFFIAVNQFRRMRFTVAINRVGGG